MLVLLLLLAASAEPITAVLDNGAVSLRRGERELARVTVPDVRDGLVLGGQLYVAAGRGHWGKGRGGSGKGRLSWSAAGEKRPRLEGKGGPPMTGPARRCSPRRHRATVTGSPSPDGWAPVKARGRMPTSPRAWAGA